MENLFFDTWQSFGKTFLMTIMAYTSLVVLLRISGKRTLSKMNAFDFVITVAMGSSLASVSLNNSIPIANGALVFSLLIFLQYFIAWLSVRVKPVKKLITAEPVLLLYQGKLIEKTLKKERVTIDDIYLAAREKGIAKLENIDAIVLETTGDITVIPQLNNMEAETLKTVQQPDISEKH